MSFNVFYCTLFLTLTFDLVLCKRDWGESLDFYEPEEGAPEITNDISEDSAAARDEFFPKISPEVTHGHEVTQAPEKLTTIIYVYVTQKPESHKDKKSSENVKFLDFFPGNGNSNKKENNLHNYKPPKYEYKQLQSSISKSVEDVYKAEPNKSLGTIINALRHQVDPDEIKSHELDTVNEKLQQLESYHEQHQSKPHLGRQQHELNHKLEQLEKIHELQQQDQNLDVKHFEPNDKRHLRAAKHEQTRLKTQQRESKHEPQPVTPSDDPMQLESNEESNHFVPNQVEHDLKFNHELLQHASSNETQQLTSNYEPQPPEQNRGLPQLESNNKHEQAQRLEPSDEPQKLNSNNEPQQTEFNQPEKKDERNFETNNGQQQTEMNDEPPQAIYEEANANTVPSDNSDGSLRKAIEFDSVHDPQQLEPNDEPQHLKPNKNPQELEAQQIEETTGSFILGDHYDGSIPPQDETKKLESNQEKPETNDGLRQSEPDVEPQQAEESNMNINYNSLPPQHKHKKDQHSVNYFDILTGLKRKLKSKQERLKKIKKRKKNALHKKMQLDDPKKMIKDIQGKYEEFKQKLTNKEQLVMNFVKTVFVPVAASYLQNTSALLQNNLINPTLKLYT